MLFKPFHFVEFFARMNMLLSTPTLAPRHTPILQQ